MVGVQKAHLTFLHCIAQAELNNVLMLDCEMGQWEEGGTVGGWVSVGQLGG